ncbi:MAG: DUF2262 domain-containing protein [Sphingomonadaceae bacterium]|jgi:hypothetical protein|nr:DUF2262 domain-containing protein [Sphingomonadaceae bacterium]
MTFSHPELGEFRAGSDPDTTVEREWTWCDKPIRLVLSKDGGSFEEAAVHALELKAKERLWNAEFTDRIHAELFDTWNDVWRQDDPEMGKAEWLGRMTMESLDVTAEGFFTAYYRDGDLFWGHWIEVFGKTDEGAKHASMMG